MSKHLYFDCNATYGPYPGKPREARWRLEELVDDLALAGIAGALVQHTQGIRGDHMRANLTLVEDITEHGECLFPCWVALPEISGGFPPVPEFVAALEQRGVRAVRIAPDDLGIPPREKLWGELRDALVAAGTLIVVETDRSVTDFTPLEETLDLFREANVLVAGFCWHQWRVAHYLMSEYPRMHIEFSGFQANRAPEYFAQTFGPDRCLFGTGLMDKAPGAARGFFDWSLLPDEEVARIAGGNLTRLLRGAQPRAVEISCEWQDEITRSTSEGLPMPCEVWDNHCHILHDGSPSAGGKLVFYKGDADGMIEITRRTGIDKTAIMSWEAPCSYDVDLGNDTVARAVDRYPDEFIGLASIDPTHQTPEEMQAVIDEYHVRRRFPGLKFLRHGGAGEYNYDNPLFEAWYSFASDRNLYAVIDPCGARDSEMMANLVARYPNMRISLDHCGQSWGYARWAAEMVKKYPMVDAQLTYTNVTNGVIEYLVAECGADRVMFGTDTPMRDPRPQVGWLVFTRLSEADKRLVFAENFKRRLEEVRW